MLKKFRLPKRWNPLNLSKAIVKLYEKIDCREETAEFPLIKPEEPEASEEQEAAMHCLKLANTSKYVDCGSIHYIHAERDKALQAEATREVERMGEEFSISKDRKRKEMEWMYNNYYGMLRRDLVRQSVLNQQFLHQWEESRFISLIPPQSIKDETKKQHAQTIVAQVKEDLMPTIDTSW